MPEALFTNARIVLRDDTIEGTLSLADGRISALDAGGTALPAIDCGGDFLLPGLIDLHTDNLEKHYQPRGGVTWDPVAAAVAHDAMCAASGITTVFDSLTIGAQDVWDIRPEMIGPMIAGLSAARGAGILRSCHLLHLRCEVTHPEIVALFERHAEAAPVRLVSLMDHTPGDRQLPDIEAYRAGNRHLFADDAALDAHVEALRATSRDLAPGRCRALADAARMLGLPLATHDDAKVEHVDEAARLGAAFTEFPTTLIAARRAREHGIPVLMGAPNLVRGASSSNNVKAGDLALAGLLDVLASDYIPASLLHAVFRLTNEPFNLPPHAAVARAGAAPAAAVGLADRGRIAVGLRADLVRVRLVDGRPIVRGVWVGGERVA